MPRLNDGCGIDPCNSPSDNANTETPYYFVSVDTKLADFARQRIEERQRDHGSDALSLRPCMAAHG